MPAEEGPAGGGETYFTPEPKSRSERSRLRFLYRGEILEFEVDRGIFASSGLDRGTELLIENLRVGPSDEVLDLGCGWGAIGIAAAKQADRGRVVMVDVNRRAALLARRNLARNGVANAEVLVGSLFDPVADRRFDVVVSNPPYRAGRSLIERFLAEAPGHLREEGRLVLVGKGSQGILYYQRRLEKDWPGPVAVLARGSGYRVIEAAVRARPGPRRDRRGAARSSGSRRG
ncbi:MAG: methyltransferase [Thermoplasmata archaeon]